MLRLFSILSTLVFAACATVCQADSSTPAVCIGAPREYSKKSWGVPLDGLCPEHFAVYGASVSRAKRGTAAAAIKLIPYCCPLPAKDILLKEHEFVDSECPDFSVVTGVEPVFSQSGRYMWDDFRLFATRDRETSVARVRCTKINTEKYSLSPVVKGTFWGVSAKEWREPFRINWSEIPPGLRYGIGRVSNYHFLENGCVGRSFGALLTAKRSRYCRDMEFRSLQTRSQSSSTQELAEVEMYPECLYVKEYQSESPECVK